VKISSQDRSALIRLASSLPAGSPERKAILAGIVQPGQEVWLKPGQMKEHIAHFHSLKSHLVQACDKFTTGSEKPVVKEGEVAGYDMPKLAVTVSRAEDTKIGEAKVFADKFLKSMRFKKLPVARPGNAPSYTDGKIIISVYWFSHSGTMTFEFALVSKNPPNQ